MPLYQKLAEIESKMAGIEVKLGHPSRRNLLVRNKLYNQVTKLEEIEDTLILPRPFINPIPPRYVNLQVSIEGVNSVFISINDLEVEIPRTIPKTLFLPEGKGRVVFIIDPPLNEDNQIIYTDPSTKTLVGYSTYKLLFISEKEPSVWKLILSKNIDNK